MVPCLLDTRSMVPTLTENFFIKHFQSQGDDKLKHCNWLELKPVNGLGIPYIGHLELDFSVLSRTLPKWEYWLEEPVLEKQLSVPSLLGINII